MLLVSLFLWLLSTAAAYEAITLYSPEQLLISGFFALVCIATGLTGGYLFSRPNAKRMTRL